MVIILGQIRFLEERIENKILLPNVFSYLKKIINLIINQNIKFILMGEIVFWTIIRTAVLIPIIWILQSYIDFQFWWIINVVAIYVIIIHPAVIHYKLFEEKNKDIIESTLCSTCRHFDKTAVLCMRHDKHPSLEFLPCQGLDWEPSAININKEDISSK